MNVEESIPVVQSKAVLSTMVRKKAEEESEFGDFSERFSKAVGQG